MSYFMLVCLFFLSLSWASGLLLISAWKGVLQMLRLTVFFRRRTAGPSATYRRLVQLCRQTDLFRRAVQRLLSCLHYPTYSANSTAWEFVQVVTVEQLIPIWHKVMRCVSKEEGLAHPARCVLTRSVATLIFFKQVLFISSVPRGGLLIQSFCRSCHIQANGRARSGQRPQCNCF